MGVSVLVGVSVGVGVREGTRDAVGAEVEVEVGISVSVAVGVEVCPELQAETIRLSPTIKMMETCLPLYILFPGSFPRPLGTDKVK